MLLVSHNRGPFVSATVAERCWFWRWHESCLWTGAEWLVVQPGPVVAFSLVCPD